MTDPCSTCRTVHELIAWRCESCQVEIACPSALFAYSTGVNENKAHKALPVLGFDGDVPMLGDEVLCGPVLEGLAATRTKRGVDLAMEQQQALERRSQITVVEGERRWRRFERTLEGAS